MIMSLRRLLVAHLLALCLLTSLCAVGLADEPLPIAPGTTHTELYRPEGPWVIHVVEADLSQHYLEMRALLGSGGSIGRGTVLAAAEAMASQESRPVAAVNGDFFALADGDYAGIPLGLHVTQGELVTLPDPARSVLYALADGTVQIARFRATAWLHGPGDLLYPLAGMNRPPGEADLVLFTPRFGGETRAHDGTTQFTLVGLTGPIRPNARLQANISAIAVTTSQRIPPDGAVLAARGVAAYALRGMKVGDEVELSLTLEPEAGEIREAIGGGPRLVREGQVSVEHLQERFAATFAARRHPRTGVGIRDGTLVMVTVDGRQPGYSEGMTLPEFAELFVELGCTEAMNLDGGGSTTMVVRDQVVNSPSGGAPRPVANVLALFTTAPVGPPTRLCVEPSEVCLLSGESLALQSSGLDQYYNPVPVPREEVKWECAPALGLLEKPGVFTAGEVSASMVGLVTARWGELTAVSVVRVAPAPARVVVVPEQVVIAPGATQQFIAVAYDDENRLLRVAEDRVAWRCEPEDIGARLERPGLLRAPTRRGVMAVVARIGEVQGTAEVWVGGAPAILADFEQPDGLPGQGWTYRGQPEGAPGEVERTDDPLRPGNHCLRLRYDFTTTAETRAALVETKLPLPARGVLSLSALGDGQGAWLRARLRDGAGQVFPLDLANQVDWSGEWRKLSVPLPEGVAAPLTLESVYLVEYHADRKPAGQIFLDDIAVAPARLPAGGQAEGAQ